MRLPGSEKVIVGYDLGNKYAQISCYVTGSEEEIRTLSSVAGSIPFRWRSVRDRESTSGFTEVKQYDMPGRKKEFWWRTF